MSLKTVDDQDQTVVQDETKIITLTVQGQTFHFAGGATLKKWVDAQVQSGGILYAAAAPGP